MNPFTESTVALPLSATVDPMPQNSRLLFGSKGFLSETAGLPVKVAKSRTRPARGALPSRRENLRDSVASARVGNEPVLPQIAFLPAVRQRFKRRAAVAGGSQVVKGSGNGDRRKNGDYAGSDGIKGSGCAASDSSDHSDRGGGVVEPDTQPPASTGFGDAARGGGSKAYGVNGCRRAASGGGGNDGGGNGNGGGGRDRRGRRGLTIFGRGGLGVLLLLLGLNLAVPGLAEAMDVNVATLEQLRTVRGIGPKTAQIIIEERTRGGKYESFEDLSDRVKGIGAKKAAALKASGLTLGQAVQGMTGPGVAASGRTRPGISDKAASASTGAGSARRISK